MDPAQAQLENAAKIVGGKAWGYDKGRARIYITMKDRDTTAYFYFPDAMQEDLGGSELSLFIKIEPYDGEVLKQRKEETLKRLAPVGMAINAATADEDELAKKIINFDGEWDDDLIYNVSNHIINGRFKEAEKELVLTDAPF